MTAGRVPDEWVGCCEACGGTGVSGDADTNGACLDCLGTGHPHDGPCRADLRDGGHCAGSGCSGAQASCVEPPRYVIVYRDHDAAGFPVCVDCCAILRANDPLEYIASVRSVERAR